MANLKGPIYGIRPLLTMPEGAQISQSAQWQVAPGRMSGARSEETTCSVPSGSRNGPRWGKRTGPAPVVTRS